MVFNLNQKARENGEYLLSKLNTLEADHQGLVSNARGRGLFCAYDLPSQEQRDKMTGLLQDEGALVLGCGYNSIRFRPHLNITQDEIDLGITMMRRALAQI